MNDAIRSTLIAALALLAVAFAAATLGSTVTTEDGPSGSGNGGGGEGEGGPLPPPDSGSPAETVVVPYLTELLTALAVLAALVLLVYALLHRREALALLVALALLFALAYLLFELIADIGGLSPPPLDPEAGSPFDDGGGGNGDGDPDAPSTPSVLSGVVLVLAVVGGLLALIGRSSDSKPERDETDPSAAPDAAAVGRAAGRAADRVEDSETENEVYRAWREMTGLLDAPEPESRTPREFADRAVEAGISEEDVEELTRLFEDVRYGERAVSEEYERRAVETLRRIERRYAEDDP